MTSHFWISLWISLWISQKVRSRLLLIFDQNQQCANAPCLFLIHFEGLSSIYDEWMPSHSLHKATPSSINQDVVATEVDIADMSEQGGPRPQPQV